MKIGIIGATGKQGRLILQETIERDLPVTAIVRNAARVTEAIPLLERDLFALTREELTAFDVVVDAFNASPGHEELHYDSLAHLIECLRGSDTRLIVVGGAGSLFVDEKRQQRLYELADFPKPFKPTALNMARGLSLLESLDDLVWTYISPAALFDYEGVQNGSYQVGGDLLHLNSQGESYISYKDYALALVDEIEEGAYLNQRISLVSG